MTHVLTAKLLLEGRLVGLNLRIGGVLLGCHKLLSRHGRVHLLEERLLIDSLESAPIKATAALLGWCKTVEIDTSSSIG